MRHDKLTTYEFEFLMKLAFKYKRLEFVEYFLENLIEIKEASTYEKCWDLCLSQIVIAIFFAFMTFDS